MFYDSVYVLGDLFHRFLLEHPEIQEDGFSRGAEMDLSRSFEEWVDRETEIDDFSHQATMMQLASSYEAIVELRDTLTTSTGL